MNLFELLKNVESENAENIKNAHELEVRKEKLKKEHDRVLKFAREQVECAEITILEFSDINKKANRMYQSQLAKLEEKFVPTSKYSQLLSQVANSKIFIGNNTVCNLLKICTQENWQTKILQKDDTLKLVFVSESGKKFLGQGAILSNDKEHITKKMENINWFQTYINSHLSDGIHLFYDSFGENKKPIQMSMYLRESLETYFRHVSIDLKNPENTSIDDTRVWKETEPVKTHNLYYRYMRDKKAAQKKTDGGK